VTAGELETITLDELATLAKQHRGTLYRAIRENRLKVVHPGNSRSTRVLLSEARRYIAGDSSATPATDGSTAAQEPTA
jgi:hypothetical protein